MTENSEQCRDGHDADISMYSIGGGGVTIAYLLEENCFAHSCYDIFSNLVSHFVVHDKWKLKKVNIYLCIVRDCTCIDGVV